jgi:hypothetical protein
MGLRAGLDAVVKRKILGPSWDSKPQQYYKWKGLKYSKCERQTCRSGGTNNNAYEGVSKSFRTEYTLATINTR